MTGKAADMLEERVERLAKILHESGRKAVEKRAIYRDDLPVKPFCEWWDLPEPDREGRRMMARYLRSVAPGVLEFCIGDVWDQCD